MKQKLYVVKYKGFRGKRTFQWRPEGEPYYCNEEQAEGRLATLIAVGKRGEKVDGVVPYRVSIEDADPPVAVMATSADGDLLSGPLEHLRKVQYTDGLPTGPWAN